jgi:hypothetical protein
MKERFNTGFVVGMVFLAYGEVPHSGTRLISPIFQKAHYAADATQTSVFYPFRALNSP